jgi:eukaryotic-like serine/threonine-protein kinase
MGEVYKARDTRLDRTVAIKVLPERIANRQDLHARFEREARAIASLNHPNICSLFDIGPGYMVMELIEGETLAARIEKGVLPLDQALKIAAQLADALDRAHRAGVTHRDVKPQNIMLTRDGVKVLDFGLAKSESRPGPEEETLTKVLTTEGTVLGTPQYMAPEQFEGKEADARSDVWAFGAVLYEMVTGRKAFEGKTYASLVGAILASEPAPMELTPITPAWLERLVRRCLAKDPEDRWQSMRDIVLELRSPPEVSAAPAIAVAPGRRWRLFFSRRRRTTSPRTSSDRLRGKTTVDLRRGLLTARASPSY